MPNATYVLSSLFFVPPIKPLGPVASILLPTIYQTIILPRSQKLKSCIHYVICATRILPMIAHSKGTKKEDIK